MNDTEGIEAIVLASHETIYGPAGVPWDLNRFQSLFFDGPCLIHTYDSETGVPLALAMNVHEYETDTSDYFCKNLS